MIKIRGFTLVELLLFITVTAILASTILLSSSTLLRNTPSLQSSLGASIVASQALEYYIGLRRTLGYSAITCPSTTLPPYAPAISGYTLSINIVCTTINSDANYKTITAIAKGIGNNTGSASVSTLIANY